MPVWGLYVMLALSDGTPGQYAMISQHATQEQCLQAGRKLATEYHQRQKTLHFDCRAQSADGSVWALIFIATAADKPTPPLRLQTYAFAQACQNAKAQMAKANTDAKVKPNGFYDCIAVPK